MQNPSILHNVVMETKQYNSMETTVKERLIKYLKFKGIGQKRFADTIGLSSGYVNAIKKSIQPDTLHRINKNVKNSGNIDNRQYYSDSPDVLRAQIELLDERIKEKDAQIKEKDAQIKEKDAQIHTLLDIINNYAKK